MTETSTASTPRASGERFPLVNRGTLGENSDGTTLYAAVPVALARSGLSASARSVALLVWSHSDGWEVSVRSIAADLGVGRVAVRRALGELQSAGWLVRTAGGVWHRQMSNTPFSKAEIQALCTPVVVGSAGNTTGQADTPPGRKSTIPLVDNRPTPPGRKSTPKEVQLKEVKLEVKDISPSHSNEVKEISPLHPNVDEPVVATEVGAEDEGPEDPGGVTPAPSSPDTGHQDGSTDLPVSIWTFERFYEIRLAEMNPDLDRAEAEERASALAGEDMAKRERERVFVAAEMAKEARMKESLAAARARRRNYAL